MVWKRCSRPAARRRYTLYTSRGGNPKPADWFDAAFGPQWAATGSETVMAGTTLTWLDKEVVSEDADFIQNLANICNEFDVRTKFYRVKKDSNMAPGTGLGLALVKHITEDVHGGRVEVESELEKGSTFRVVLPASEQIQH